MDAVDAVEFTPLKLAIDNGSRECAYVLLEAGAKPESASVNGSAVPDWVYAFRVKPKPAVQSLLSSPSAPPFSDNLGFFFFFLM